MFRALFLGLALLSVCTPAWADPTLTQTPTGTPTPTPTWTPTPPRSTPTPQMVPCSGALGANKKTATCTGCTGVVQVYGVPHSGHWAAGIPVSTPITCPGYNQFPAVFDQCYMKVVSGGPCNGWIDRYPVPVAEEVP